MEKENNQLAIYQAENGALELRADASKDTIWASKKQIAEIFGIDRSVVSRHIKNIFNDAELDEKVVCAKFAHTTQHGALKGKQQTNLIDYYNLDIILSVGYRTKSSRAIQFRQWANNILKKHITEGFSLNPKMIEQNKQLFLQTLNDLKLLTQNSTKIEIKDILSLIQNFSHTWFTLDSYDKNEFPKQGTQEEIQTSATELQQDLQKLKVALIKKGEASELFAQEKKQGNLEGIFGSVFQSVFGQDAYLSVEEKAAHLLYFIIKNHPFNDGNKRSGAFSFIWLLQKANYSFQEKINPETLATLTILIAESNPEDKDKMVGVILLLLRNR
ncbi:MAG: death-on-curing protein [Flavobacteriales bacterium CG18_big_fil_WC_8_21_14_2_50_32_9]|nr:MAG: death-on-curing protein [Flavobacteriales bacterium CG18_big_fil_WC_8_21_14_2_50_32_9]